MFSFTILAVDSFFFTLYAVVAYATQGKKNKKTKIKKSKSQRPEKGKFEKSKNKYSNLFFVLGKGYPKALAELLAVTPFVLGSFVLMPVYISWFRIIARFVDSPLAAKIAKLS